MIADGPPANRPPHIELEPLSVLLSRSLKSVALGCAVLLAGCDRESGGQAQPQASSAAPAKAGAIDRSRKGSQMPDFQLKDPAGKELNLASLKGKPVLINLWATWCAPCAAELPQLNQLAADNPGIRVLTVNQDMDKLDRVAPFLAQKGGTSLEPWLNPDNSLAFQFGAETLPATVYYDAQGREVWRVLGERKWIGEDTKALLAEAE
jgi:thiol-disulfide isomerase/thioredoxin